MEHIHKGLGFKERQPQKLWDTLKCTWYLGHMLRDRAYSLNSLPRNGTNEWAGVWWWDWFTVAGTWVPTILHAVLVPGSCCTLPSQISLFLAKTILSDGEERNILTTYFWTFDIQEWFMSTIVSSQEYQCDCPTETVRVTCWLRVTDSQCADVMFLFVVHFLEARDGSKALYMLSIHGHSLMYVGCQCAGLGFRW